MFDFAALDRRPVIVALAGPNGAGKTTFFGAYLQQTGLRFLNADTLSRELQIDAYTAARLLANVREQLLLQRESFIFETVFSDPVGDKLAFLKRARDSGYNVVLCFIGLANAALSESRVAMRVSQGGHDVPTEKLLARFPRTLANLRKAIRQLPRVIVFDNSDMHKPFRLTAAFENSELVSSKALMPSWLR
jgi:predicted ABC-type ATPase